MENLRFFSSSSKSETLLPSSTLPRRSTALAVNSSASASEVFPTPPCPTSATVRMSSTLCLAMKDPFHPQPGRSPDKLWRTAGVSRLVCCAVTGLVAHQPAYAGRSRCHRLGGAPAGLRRPFALGHAQGGSEPDAA